MDPLKDISLGSASFSFWGGISVLILLIILTGRSVYRKEHTTSRFPPGPRGHPLVGNLFQIPSTFFWYQLETWFERFGPVYTIWMASQPIVVLNTAAAAAEVLDRQSGITSGRPRSIKGSFFGTDQILGTMEYSPRWRAGRRAMHASFNLRSTVRFAPLQAYDAINLCLGLLRHPDKPLDVHIHRFSASVIFRCLYGHDGFSLDGGDPSLNMRRLTDELMQAVLPQNSIVDMFPF
ncbi:cytochrome P450 [Dacryopinax primogenitus]|uniref:Cytochrome P450 n=1 Tax=Dacryopinax primogenitus (strain DJM 731) TaxID=1858805 RepID=M5FQ13_DACPD|nr:cytochrome P450 [Dacryopinax primogenitus]EJT98910.1 cytochrome P450 [Dacryopinax primogenitus]